MCSFPADIIGFFSWPYPSNRTLILGSTQPLTGISTRNIPGGKADNLTSIYEQLQKKICEPIVYKTWEPLRLITLLHSVASYNDGFLHSTFIHSNSVALLCM
jgi:hypothetical protein